MGQNFAPKSGQVIDPTFFHTFFVKTCFFQKSHSPCRKKRIFEKQKKTTKNNKKQTARLLTYAGQVIDPTAYIYIYICAVELIVGLFCVKNWSKFFVYFCFENLVLPAERRGLKKNQEKLKNDPILVLKLVQLCCATCLDQFLTQPWTSF